MYKLVLVLIFSGLSLSAKAESKNIESICQKNADIALSKVAEALGMGKGVGHIGGSELSDEIVIDGNGNKILTFVGGPLADDDTDGYLTGTGAIVKMVITGKSSCEVDNVEISTGASFKNSIPSEEQTTHEILFHD